MRKIHAILFILALVPAVVSFAADNKISFATAEGTEACLARLKSKGLKDFMEAVWAQGVDAPGIHSKYWLDQFTKGKPELYKLEKAYRDFGYEVAVQLDAMAIEIHEKPDKALEKSRLD